MINQFNQPEQSEEMFDVKQRNAMGLQEHINLYGQQQARSQTRQQMQPSQGPQTPKPQPTTQPAPQPTPQPAPKQNANVPQFTSDLYKNIWQRFLFESNNDTYAAAQKMEQRFKENYQNWQAAARRTANDPTYRISGNVNDILRNILNNEAAFRSWLDNWISQQQQSQLQNPNMPPAWN